MNDIVKPLTPDGLVGWDTYGQLWRWRVEGERRDGTIIADVRDRICPICRQGWRETADSLGDQYHWMQRGEWAHETCYIRFLALTEFEFWVRSLVQAGFIFGREDNPESMSDKSAALEALPNGYSKDPWCAGRPWYRARLLKKLADNYTNAVHGRTLKLGSRKRVYHMEIEPGEGPYDMAAASNLFKHEDVTKEIRENGMMVHAWGDAKAKEYLGHFYTILGIEKRK